jgi:EpsI family protein
MSISYFLTTGLLAGTLLLSGLTARRVPDFLAVPLDRIDTQISGWTATEDKTLDEPTLRALDATSYLSRNYQKGAAELNLFIAFYAQQRAGESMHSPKHCLPGAGWEIWRQNSATVDVAGEPIRVNKYSIENLNNRMLMFYWYQSKDRIIANEYLGKLLLARDTLLTGHTAGSIVRIVLPDTPEMNAEGMTFTRELILQVRRSFGSAAL